MEWNIDWWNLGAQALQYSQQTNSLLAKVAQQAHAWVPAAVGGSSSSGTLDLKTIALLLVVAYLSILVVGQTLRYAYSAFTTILRLLMLGAVVGAVVYVGSRGVEQSMADVQALMGSKPAKRDARRGWL